jgi:hypothetical protein
MVWFMWSLPVSGERCIAVTGRTSKIIMNS